MRETVPRRGKLPHRTTPSNAEASLPVGPANPSGGRSNQKTAKLVRRSPKCYTKARQLLPTQKEDNNDHSKRTHH